MSSAETPVALLLSMRGARDGGDEAILEHAVASGNAPSTVALPRNVRASMAACALRRLRGRQPGAAAGGRRRRAIGRNWSVRCVLRVQAAHRVAAVCILRR
jgi:hypothetical protein